MHWTHAQKAAMANEYSRVGYVSGESWPAPPDEMTPDDVLALFGTIPDGAGRKGYMAALAHRISGVAVSFPDETAG